MLQGHVSQLPRAPHLVAYAPVFHGKGLGRAVAGPQAAHRRGRAAVGVFHLGGRGVGVAKAGVDRDQRLGADLPAKGDVFVEAEIVGLDALPGRILALGRRSVSPRPSRES